jgi:segregation and condensation protein B
MMDGSIAHDAEIEPQVAPTNAAEAAPKQAEEQTAEAEAEEAEVEEGAAEGAAETAPPVVSSMPHEMRMLEAMLFAATEPVDEASLAERLPEDADLKGLLAELASHYEGRGVVLAKVAGRWAFRTAPDLSGHLSIEKKVTRKLSRASVETLAIIAYHQPITRGEIEEIRGVALSKGTLDLLLEIGWIRPVGRRRTPGRPVTWGTSTDFLDQFGLNSLSDLPGVDELKAAGLLDSRPVTTILGEAMGRDMAGPDAEDGDEAEGEEEERVAGSMDADEIEASFEAEGEEAEDEPAVAEADEEFDAAEDEDEALGVEPEDDVERRDD